MEIKQISVKEIVVSNDRRKLIVDSSRWLKESISLIGLRTPISVRARADSGYDLVAGRQRLLAVTQLGHHVIDAFVYDTSTSDLEIELWEVSENDHRSDLTVMERAALDGQFARLKERAEKDGLIVPPVAEIAPASEVNPVKDKPVQVAQVSKRGVREGRGNKGGVSQLARDLGRPRDQVRRSLKINSLSDDAKEKAQELGLDNNQDALLKAAKHDESAQQVQTLTEIAGRRQEVVEPAPPKTPSADISDFLAIWEAASKNKRLAIYHKVSAWKGEQ